MSSREAVNMAQTIEVFWSDSARKSNPDLPTTRQMRQPQDHTLAQH